MTLNQRRQRTNKTCHLFCAKNPPSFLVTATGVMQPCEMSLMQKFTRDQVVATRAAALKLRDALRRDRDPMAGEFLKGELGKILNSVIYDIALLPIANIPHFSEMTRDYLPNVEAEYFNFYSLAASGEPANV